MKKKPDPAVKLYMIPGESTCQDENKQLKWH